MTLAEHIEELIAESRGALTRRERNAVRAELAGAIAAQAEIERAPAGVARARGGDHVCKVLNSSIVAPAAALAVWIDASAAQEML